MSTSWAQLLIQFYTNLFKTLYIFSIVWRCAWAFYTILALIFITFFSTLWTLSFSDLSCLDSGCHVIATPHTILYWSLWNFAHVFSRVCRCACGLDIILKLIFLTFFTLLAVVFLPQILWKYINTEYLLSTTSHASYENMHVFSMKFLY